MFTRPKTDFLFSNGSVLVGAGSILNIAGNYFEFNLAESEDGADEMAIGNDWLIVGQDLRDAMDAVEPVIDAKPS